MHNKPLTKCNCFCPLFVPGHFNNICSLPSSPKHCGYSPTSHSSPLLIPHSFIPAFSEIIPLILFFRAIILLILPYSVLQTNGVSEVFALLGCYSARLGSSLPTFRDSLSVPSSKMKQCSSSHRLLDA